MAQAQAEARLLVVEDDSIVRRIVVTALAKQGFRVAEATDAASALSRYALEPVDLVIIDINLPDGNGYDLCARLRGRRDVAVIYMSSMGSPAERIRGLDTGGDDYLVKPVDLGELGARVRAVLRRFRQPPVGQGSPYQGTRNLVPMVEFNGWTLDLVRRELADPAAALVRLTRAEFDLFAALVQAEGKVLSREYLLEVVSSAETETQPRTIDVMISRIRKKFAAASTPTPKLLTIKGLGYSFERGPD